MSEKPLDWEEIKGILDELADLYNIPEKRILLDFKEIKQKINLAVQGLLQEIEEDIAYWKKVMEEYEEKELNAKTEEERKEYDEYWKIAEQVHRVLDIRVRNLIKKYFHIKVKK